MKHNVQPPKASTNYSGAGIGGKLRRSIFRPSTTPYDRPPAATRQASWMSKVVVDPASKLLDFGARRFFAMLFPNKRLPPPPLVRPIVVEEQERRNGLQETAIDVKISARGQEPVADVCGTSSVNNDNSGLPELEQLLKQKNFTRSEIDRLTELLKSRANALPDKDDRHGFKLNLSDEDSRRHQEYPTTSNINKSESSEAHRASHPAVTTREQDMQQHIEDQISSPAELAKAYMSSRPTNLSPSALGFLDQIAREDLVPPSNSTYTSKSQLSLLPVKTSGYSGGPGNGFTTPRSRGRSAIYNMARTPYSRFNLVTHQKGSGSKNLGDSRLLLASRSPSENGGQVAPKPMALKRRSTVLDDEIGSIGPIRRIRQKHNLLTQGKSISGKGLGSDFTRSPNRYSISNADPRGASSSSASYSHVPRESSEMAAKIFEHLEKMTPKEKSPDSKLTPARGRSTFKLTSHMLDGQTSRSMKNLDAKKLLLNSQKDQMLVDQPVSRLPDFHEYTKKQVNAEEQSPVKPVLHRDNLALDRVVQGSKNSSIGYGAPLSFSSQPPERKRPFKMSAHEEWIEMDDDHCNEREPESSGKGVKEPMRDSMSAFNENKILDNSPISVERTHATPVLSSTDLKGGNVLAAENSNGDKFSSSFAPNTSSQKVLSQSTEVFSSGSAFSGVTSAVDGVTESDTNGDNTVNGNLGRLPSLASNPMSTNIVSVDGPSTDLASTNGPLSSSAHFSFNSSGPASVKLSNQSFINSSSNLASSAGATTSTSVISDSVVVPANGAPSNLSERITISDNSLSKSSFSAPTIGSTEAIAVTAEKVNGLFNFSNSSTVSTFPSYGIGTSASSSAANSLWPSSASGTSVINESTLAGSGSANVSQSTPVHFGLSGVAPQAASIGFGSSVPATKSEGTTQNCASASESDQVNSSNGAAPIFKFGGGASASAHKKAFGSADTASQGTSLFSASFSNPASSSTSLFSFNAGSSAPGMSSFNAGSSSSGISVGNTTSGVFKFGATPMASSSSANAVTSGSSTVPSIFGFPASVPPSSSVSNKVSSSGLNSSTFASSSQAPTSSFVPPFTMSSSTGFSLGASSPAFGTSNPSIVFGSNNGVPSNPTFSFTQSSGTQNVFGNSASPFTTNPGNNDQMSAEDSMAEDPIQSSPPAAPGFGQSLISPSPPGFMFGSTASSAQPPGAPFQFSQSQVGQQNPFQFSQSQVGQQNPFQFSQSQVGQQNPSLFQASSSSEFNAGGSFSLGSSDKSGRKFVKVNRNRNRKMR